MSAVKEARKREKESMKTYRHRDEGEDKEGEGEERVLGGTERKESGFIPEFLNVVVWAP